jgi:small subunit ribosomal protein S16
MLKIRLQRVGRKNVPTFRIVLTESKNSTKSGKFLEILGSHDPIAHKSEIKADRVKHWLAQGVQLTATVNNLFINKGIIKGKKIDKNPKKTVEKKAEEAPVAESATPEPEATPAEKQVEVAPQA